MFVAHGRDESLLQGTVKNLENEYVSEDHDLMVIKDPTFIILHNFGVILN